MELRSFQVDAFTDKIFSGNPAGVLLLERELSQGLLLKIAKENALPETAFIMAEKNRFRLRWFTPDLEMDLCGHATLAAAHIIFTELGYDNDPIFFDTISGKLSVKRAGRGYILDFPLREAVVSDLPGNIRRSLNIDPPEIYKARDYMLVFPSQEDVESVVIDRFWFDKVNLDPGGVIVTAKGDDCDFVSRYFTPQATIMEDPVTGSAHCTLAPYWAKKLGRNKLYAKQLSDRGGTICCTVERDRVMLEGEAVTYSKGVIYVKN